MMKLGDKSVSALRLGGRVIKKAYLGAKLIFDPEPAVPVYTITAAIDPEGSGTVTGAGQYREGETVTLVAAPSEGYKFTGWQEGGQTVSTNTTYSFTVTGDRTLVGVFEENTSRLPKGYVEVEYIELDGCCIDTGIQPSQYKKLVMDVQPLVAATENTWLVFNSNRGVNSNQYKYFCALWTNVGVRVKMGLGVISYKTVGSNASPRRFSLSMDYYGKTASVDSASITTANNTWSTQSTAENIQLLGANGGYCTNARLYSCQISTDRNFVPCKNPSGQIGVYDLVGAKFYAPTGDGTIYAGPAV